MNIDSAKIDRYGDLDRRIALFAPVLAEHKQLKDEIVLAYCDAPPGQAFLAEGKLYQLQIGARGKERTITQPLSLFRYLQKALGIEALVSLITIPLTSCIDKFVPATKQALYLVEERTGPRKVECVAKTPPTGKVA